MGIENDFAKDDDRDNPVAEGEGYCMPGNFICVEFRSLSVKDEDYMKLTLEYITNFDLTEAKIPGYATTLTSEKAIEISVDKTEALVLDQGDINAINGTAADRKTETIWIYGDGAPSGAVLLFYEDTNNKIHYAGNMTTAS